MGTPLKLETIIQIPSAWSAVSGRFGVHLFEGHLGIADMDRMETRGDEWHAKNPGRLVELVVVFPSDSRMTSAERVRMSRLIKRWEKERDASATVILAEGMLGAMQRSVLTGMLMLAPPPHPSKIFGSLPEAMTWLYPFIRPLCKNATTRDVVLGAVEEMSRSFMARARPPRPA